MALGFLFITTIIIGIIIAATITIAFLKKDTIFNEIWFIYCSLILIAALTVIAFTALPSSYVIYRIIAISLGALGALGVYLGKLKKLGFKMSIVIIAISLIGNYYISFFI